MINTSNEFNNRISNDRTFVLKADLTFPNNEKIILLDNEIIQGGMEFEDAVSGNGSFQIGAAIINKHTITIANYNHKFDTFDFEGATLVPYVGLQLSETVEFLKKGFYTVDESNAIGDLIVLECLDNMHRFERAFKNVTINFPITAINLLQAVCTHCGVFLNTTFFTNSNFIIQSRPIDEALSCLDIVSYIAQIAGCFARCNANGALELKWYDLNAFEDEDSLDGGQFDDNNQYSTGDNADGGNFNDYNSGNAYDGGSLLQTKKYWHLYDFGSTPTIGADDVVITGIKIENTDSENGYSAVFGYDGYVLAITNNPLIQRQIDANAIANLIGAKIVGMRFRIFSAACLGSPAIEAGDPAYLSIRTSRGYNTYQSFITNSSYKVGSREQISCNAETPNRNSSTRYSSETKAIIKAREQAKQQLTEYDLAVQQLNSVMANAMGYYPIREEQADGSYIDYMADKPTLEESQIIWKKSINGFAISIDGGQTWTSGMTADGNIIAKTLSVIGINAEWIKVITSFTVGNNFSVDHLGNMISESGRIGPFVIDKYGLKSRLLEFMERDSYPLIWLTKPAKDGSLNGGDGWSRANYEPDVTVLRNIDGNVETYINIMARNRPDTGETGTFQIVKHNGNKTISNTTLSDNGLIISKDDNAEDLLIQLSKIGLTVQDIGNNSGFSIISAGGDLYIQSSHAGACMFTNAGTFLSSYSNTPVYLNGVDVVSEINSLRNRLNTAESDLFNIKLRLGML